MPELKLDESNYRVPEGTQWHWLRLCRRNKLPLLFLFLCTIHDSVWDGRFSAFEWARAAISKTISAGLDVSMWRSLLTPNLRQGADECFLDLFLNEREPLFSTDSAASEVLDVVLELINSILRSLKPP